MTNAPRLFISYSWSNPEHEAWVIDLATTLQEAGVDVIFDKWDLKEGHDAYAFMEKMVTDPTITKVAVISDKTYAEKADGRAGGVGTETQIISREVYEKQSQDKFVAVLPEKDAQGKPFLPTYFKGRIHIDLSDSSKYAENLEKLLRWVFNKPLHKKPALGKMPSYLEDGPHISLGTTAALARALDAIKTSKPYAPGAIDEYFEVFAKNLERFRITETDEKPLDDLVVESVEEFLPFRNEAIQLFTAIAQYQPSEDFARAVHRFFERLISYLKRPDGAAAWSEQRADNFSFIINELYLYALAILIKRGRFAPANYLIETPYYVPTGDFGGEAIRDFSVFRRYVESLEIRRRRLKIAKHSLHALMLKDRAEGSGVDLQDVMQADFILFLRGKLEGKRWWPETLVYSTHAYNPFEVFARASSSRYFQEMKVLLGIQARDDLNELMEDFRADPRNVPAWQFDRVNPWVLMGWEKLAKG